LEGMVLDFDGEVTEEASAAAAEEEEEAAAAAAAAVDEGGGSACDVSMEAMGEADGGGGAEWRADATARYLKV